MTDQFELLFDEPVAMDERMAQVLPVEQVHRSSRESAFRKRCEARAAKAKTKIRRKPAPVQPRLQTGHPSPFE